MVNTIIGKFTEFTCALKGEGQSPLANLLEHEA